MKIDNKNKRDAYKRFINRTGKSAAIQQPKKVNEQALNIMRTKPYGMGSIETKEERNGDGSDQEESSDRG